MGLFSKKEPPYNPEKGAENKRKMRALFNDAVENGDDYQLVSMNTSSSRFEKGFVINTQTTTFHFYILGYQPGNPRILLLVHDPEFTVHGEPVSLNLQEIQDATYYRKLHQLAMHQKKEYIPPRETGNYIFHIGDASENSLYIKSLRQEEERQGLLALAERYFPIQYKK